MSANSTPEPVTLGPLTLVATGSHDITGQTAGRIDTDGNATTYTVTGPARLRLTLQDIAWDNGERDVRASDRHSSPQRFDRLTHGLRLTINTHTDGRLRCDLRQARMVDTHWANPRRADLAELSHPIGQPLDQLLFDLGATAVGPRREVLGDTSPHRNSLCVVFPPTATLIPAVAYATTRIAPVQERISA